MQLHKGMGTTMMVTVFVLNFQKIAQTGSVCGEVVEEVAVDSEVEEGVLVQVGEDLLQEEHSTEF